MQGDRTYLDDAYPSPSPLMNLCIDLLQAWLKQEGNGVMKVELGFKRGGGREEGTEAVVGL